MCPTGRGRGSGQCQDLITVVTLELDLEELSRGRCEATDAKLFGIPSRIKAGVKPQCEQGVSLSSLIKHVNI